MNPEQDHSSIGEEPVTDEEAGAGYEPPAFVVLGSVEQLTGGTPDDILLSTAAIDTLLI